MAQKLLIVGESGSGKTCSIRNCDPATTAIVSPEKESLPFGKKAQKYPGKFDMLCNETDSKKITKFMKDEVANGKSYNDAVNSIYGIVGNNASEDKKDNTDIFGTDN